MFFQQKIKANQRFVILGKGGTEFKVKFPKIHPSVYPHLNKSFIVWLDHEGTVEGIL